MPSALESTVTRYLNNNQLSVPLSAFAPPAAATLNNLLGGNAFVLDQAAITNASATAVTVAGNLNLALTGNTPVQTRAVFTRQGRALALAWTTDALSKPLALDTALPGLGGIFAEFVLLETVFVFDSSQTSPISFEGLPPELPLAAAPAAVGGSLRISGNVQLAAPPAGAQDNGGEDPTGWITEVVDFTEGRNFAVQGSLQWWGNQIAFKLATPRVKPLKNLSGTVQDSNVSFALQSTLGLCAVPLMATDANRAGGAAFGQLTARFTKPPSPELAELKLAGLFASFRAPLLTIDISDRFEYGVSQITKLIGVNIDKLPFPKGFPGLKQPLFSALQFDISLPEFTLSSVALTLEFENSNNKGWSLLDGEMVLQDFGLSIGSNGVLLFATTDLFKSVSLTTVFDVNQLYFSALPARQPADITRLVHTVMGGDLNLPKIVADEFMLDFSFLDQSYGLAAHFQSDWTPLRKPEVTISDVSLNISFQGLSFTSGFFSGTFQLDEAPIQITAAKYAGGQWTFSGGTTTAAAVPVSRIIEQFLGARLPSFLPEVDLANIYTEFSTDSKNFQFTGDIRLKERFTLAGRKIDFNADARLAINYMPDSGGNNGVTTSQAEANAGEEIDGGEAAAESDGNGAPLAPSPGPLSVLIDAGLQVGDVEFAVGILLAENDYQFSGLFEEAAGKVLQTGELLAFLKVGTTLPDFLDVKLIEAGFDFNFSRSQFLLEAESEEYGDLFLILGRGDGWNIAFGIDISNLNHPSEILSSLSFLDFIQVQQLSLSYSNFSGASVSLAQLSQFVSARGDAGFSSQILPAQLNQQLSQGLIFYGQLTLNNDTDHGELGPFIRFFKIDAQLLFSIAVQNPGGDNLSVKLLTGLTADIGNPAPDLKVSRNEFNLGLNIYFGLTWQADALDLFFLGSLNTVLGKTPFTFDVKVDLNPNGFFIAGDLREDEGSQDGKSPQVWKAPLGIKDLALGDLAIEVGVSDEAIPTVGVAATVFFQDFEGSFAVLFNSSQPDHSLLLASVTDMPLSSFQNIIIGILLPDKFQWLNEVLNGVSVRGVAAFAIRDNVKEVREALNRGVVSSAVVDAFLQGNGDRLSTDRNYYLLYTVKKNKAWFLTNKQNQIVYQLKAKGNVIQVSLEAQLYIAPFQATIATLVFPQGFHLDGTLDVYGFDISARINFLPSIAGGLPGFSVEATMQPIRLFGGAIEVVQARNRTKQGPFFSLSTYSETTINGKRMGPHIGAGGYLRFFGLEKLEFELQVGSDGWKIEIDDTFAVAGGDIHYGINSTFNGDDGFSAGGEFGFTEDLDFDLGPLGHLKLADAGVEGGIEFERRKGSIDIDARAKVDLGAFGLSLPKIEVEVTISSVKNALHNLRADAVKALEDAADDVKKLFLDNPKQWAKAAGYLIDGVADDADKFFKILRDEFGIKDDLEQAAKLADEAEIGLVDTAKGLQSVYGASEQDVAKALRAVTGSADKVGDTIMAAFHHSVEVAGKILDEVGFKADEILSFEEDFESDISSFVEVLGNRAGSFVADLGSDARNLFSNIDSNAESFLVSKVGDLKSDVISGILDVLSGVSAAEDFVESLAGNLKSDAEGVLSDLTGGLL